MTMPHPDCWTGDRYVHESCRRPSGRTCIEDGCDRPAGTAWGPPWCPEHDVERLDRIDGRLHALAKALEVRP